MICRKVSGRARRVHERMMRLDSYVMGRIRAGVVLRDHDSLVVIQRVRHGHTYYVLPGGGVELDEIPSDAAARESFEELGITVIIGDLLATVWLKRQNSWQYYFDATATGGTFGTGTGPEYRVHDTERGTYKPMWLPCRQLDALDVRPRQLALALCAGLSLRPPLQIVET